MRYKGVSPGAKLCYSRLYRYAGENGKCFPRQRDLAPEIGVTERQVRSYLRELEAEGFIRTIQKGLRMPNEYEFRWHPIFAGSERKDTSGQERKKPSGQERKEVSDPNPRESKKESHLKEAHSSSSGVVVEKNSPPTPSLPNVEAPKTNSSHKKIDDDERGAQPKFASDRDELISLIEQATGTPPDGKLIEDIVDRLKLREMSLREYLDDIRPRLKRLRFRAGAGFFHSQASEPKRSRLVATEPHDFRRLSPRCEHCKGIGKKPGGEYCGCALGRDLERVERQMAKPARGAA
jgi:hypothetical protein